MTLLAGRAIAANAQADYLKKISENISGGGSSSSTDSGDSSVGGGASHVLAFVVLIAAVVMILFWWNARQSRPKKVKHINHSRKLLRQISRQVGLASDEVRQLKVLADVHAREMGQAIENPLTLLLCPSLLTRSLESSDVKIDRAVVARMARRVSQKPKG